MEVGPKCLRVSYSRGLLGLGEAAQGKKMEIFYAQMLLRLRSKIRA
ncbi:hypothetical protein Q31a_38480 [Aureliella helgolandensis]|uniref:Uncharacterized protein n=1 Tax=Aureliella helgolandensis TaxID=2527968 RepID=A0A518GAB0_9BACT|nr:hypothetical protein Q31a_38480 [Aureliella helgolandensis]